MDVKYIPSDWEKMKDGIGDLIGLGRWGKGMIDTLKDLSDNLEDAESDIANYDSDGVITFHHTSQKSKYQGLFEDFEILHNFTGKVGEIVDRTIDQPFYEDMDEFVQTMRDLTISNYTTTNRVGATETQYVYAGYGPAQSLVVPKTEVSLDDLFSGDTYYSSQMKLEYDAWKELNGDQDFSQEEYQQAALNTRAFEYESIRDQQEDKEFWVQIGALVVIVGATLICPPAGLALGAAYGAMELSSAVSGKDWVSGRELGTSERWFRGLLAPLDIVPGVSGLTKFSSTVRLAHLGENIGGIGLRSGVKGSFHQEINHVDNMVKTAGQQSVTRLKGASAAIIDTTNVMKNKLAKDTVEAGRLVDSAITQVKNITPPRRMGLAMESASDFGKVQITAGNSNAVENRLKDVLSKIDGVNIGKGSPKKGIKTVDTLLTETRCSHEDLYKYLKNNDSYSKTNYAEVYLKTGEWPEDIQIPKNPRVLNEDGSINWSEVPNGGYVLDADGNAIKEVYVPKPAEILDRYGPANGRYTSPVLEGKPFNYDQRSLPYLEDLSKYHQYEVTGDFSKLEDYVSKCKNPQLKLKIEAQVLRYYNGDYSKVVTHQGGIAEGFGSSGGGIQNELPLPVGWLEELGLLKEVK
ncbi:TNT domain-containing protein [Neobacillus sp. BF23-41]|uniref:TNT domain-containing protein n=1 Tax=Neobacillus sp. BF23-41 TaxID=3240280 RepID=UPI0034E558FC